MRLLLIRHGQTPSNVLGALDTMVPGPGLTELGREQAAAIPGALSDERIGAVFASVQTRAQLTATPLSTALELPIRVREGLREISAGDLEMATDREAIAMYHEVTFGWARGDLERRMPGGETGEEVFSRFDDVIAEAASSGEGTVACVAHGQIIRAWTGARSRNVDADTAQRHILHNTGVVAFDGSPDTGWTVRSWTGTALGGPVVDDGAATGPAGSVD